MRAGLVLVTVGVVLLVVAWPRPAHGRPPAGRTDGSAPRDEAFGSDTPETPPGPGDVEAQPDDSDPADVDGGAGDVSRRLPGAEGEPPSAPRDEEPGEPPRLDPPTFEAVRPLGPASAAAPVQPGAY
ncbi:MAG TPA: hypothetical protein VFD84_04705 [Candidatus Binatia bacterium]|jgi:hypothetical protein|nr:hypothetical protein [Candidatus Binatia bacterium]